MSDKEFDKQFRNKFEDFELEPSSSIWGKIDSELKVSEKKPFPWFTIAAASMAAIITVGIWFGPHKQPMKLYGKAKVKEPAIKETIIPEVSSVDEDVKKVDLTLVQPLAFKPVKTRIKVKQADAEIAKDVVAEEKRSQEEASLKEPELNNSLVAANSEVITVEPLSRRRTQTENLALQIVQEDTTAEKSKHRIKSVGDLVNFVVSKVDKRKNKIIEFSKDDEGEEISGLNLGLLQYKTRNN